MCSLKVHLYHFVYSKNQFGARNSQSTKWHPKDTCYNCRPWQITLRARVVSITHVKYM